MKEETFAFIAYLAWNAFIVLCNVFLGIALIKDTKKANDNKDK